MEYILAVVALLLGLAVGLLVGGARSQRAYERGRSESLEAADRLRLANDELALRFKTLANEIFDDKAKRISEQNRQGLESLLLPLGEKIKDFEKRVEETYDKESKQRFSLTEEIRRMQELNVRISDEANHLATALKGQTKTQGNWGEVILERVLENSGLTKGKEYDVQVNVRDAEGNRYMPDVVIRLPDERFLVIDSKVSLTAYERYCSAELDGERDAALKEHIGSVRRHLIELGEKRYQDLYGAKSPDLVLMFIPVEPSFYLAARHDVDLFQEAYRRNIMLVGPSTLLATLRTIESIWRNEKQNRNALEIADESGKLYDKFVGFVGDMENLGDRLRLAQSAYDDARKKLDTGTGNLVRRAEKVRSLGAKAGKRLPAAMIETALDAPDEPETQNDQGIGLAKSDDFNDREKI